MKRAFLISFFIFSCLISQAKDSIIVFKFAIGLNYNLLTIQSLRANNQLRTYDTTDYSVYNTVPPNKKGTLTIIAPMTQVGMQKMFNKSLGININILYSYNKVEYQKNQGQNLHYNGMSLGGIDGTFIENKYIVKIHNFLLSIGPVINAKRLYFIPKFNSNYLIYKTESNEIVTLSDSLRTYTDKSSFKDKNDKIIFGAGITIGYYLRKSKRLYIEIQPYYFKQFEYYQKNGFNTSFVFGIKL